jgi:putative hydrolase of HD superfamily
MGRVLELLTVHDLVEVYAGDTLIYDEEAVKHQAVREEDAAEKLYGLLPPDQAAHFLSRWREFEDRVTPESRYARAIDALAPTWLHWGEHASPTPELLSKQHILRRKAEALHPYPQLYALLEQVVESAARRGLLTDQSQVQ